MTIRQTLIPALAGLCTALLCPSCTTDEALTADAGSPIQFRAWLQEDPAARATSANTWDGGEEVAVEVDGTVVPYVAAADGFLTVRSGYDPHLWNSKTADISVRAWYPYGWECDDLHLDTDQTGATALQDNDRLQAEIPAIAFGHTADLTFLHRTALVSVALVADATLAMMGLSIAGLNIYGVEAPATVSADFVDNLHYNTVHLAPQTIAGGTAFITVRLSNGTELTYSLPAAGLTLDQSKQYCYHITASLPGLSVSAPTIAAWTSATLSTLVAPSSYTTVDVTGLADDPILLSGNVLLTGTTATQVRIANGSNVLMQDFSTTNNVECEGNAHIRIAGTNTIDITASALDRTALLTNATLVLEGTGSLTVRSWSGVGIGGGFSNLVFRSGTYDVSTADATGATLYPAAIGAGASARAGNLIIEGGTIQAQGGGSDDAVCGGAGIGTCASATEPAVPVLENIIIRGGTVTATGGKASGSGYRGAGIGIGHNGRVGSIHIAGTVDHVTAQQGSGAQGPASLDGGTGCTIVIDDESKVTR